MVFLNYALLTIMYTAMGLYFYAFCQLYKIFAYINIALRSLGKQFGQLLSIRHQQVLGQIPLEDVTRHLGVLNGMHFNCFCLTQRIFHLCELSFAAIFLRLFTTNVRVIYQVVWFLNHDIAADTWILVNTFTVVFLYSWDMFLLMRVIDDLLSASRTTAHILRQFTHNELQLQANRNCIQTLTIFADYLRCHKLSFLICGFFHFNKEASLKYFFTVIVQVIVLVQFDMQRSLHNAEQ
ncbi:putative gustatory receptor 58a [Teleopsis dalmanni]|uniref:putative gustatory receptor 58a n=1 Tax=Teleopsis dalmanni TaxID=139649 RepID=UPI0018CC989D|nr:putative gustatory receptor 58a [Teleopsis dalmanni]XP_037952000.1 putative gustatory receptor 58a [Teleopsis dalmanni]